MGWFRHSRESFFLTSLIVIISSSKGPGSILLAWAWWCSCSSHFIDTGEANPPYAAHFLPILNCRKMLLIGSMSSIPCSCLEVPQPLPQWIPVQWQESGTAQVGRCRGLCAQGWHFLICQGRETWCQNPPSSFKAPFLPRTEEQHCWMHTIKGKPYFPARAR